ncbi:MAG: 1-deoxy-D-xylulose-5-phosphate reductoisomerase [Ruminococcaceae bacterium]|nr:1-deoxy-D-xylulose-5-phosphate reductoisomerase [Oscillospiraceae bacterium]
MKNIAVLGSTGSIGTQCLDIAESDKNINITALSANSNVKLLEEQIRKFNPPIACIVSEEKYKALKDATFDLSTKIVCGKEGLLEVASNKNTDTVLNSIVGMAGLVPTICAIKNKKRILLANKETLVCAGDLINKLLKENNVDIIPVDSEHSAIFQCINGEKKEKLKRIILTASGGPFFGKKKEDLQNITKYDALKHPNWDMGAKITIDSATLMNKGLEIIEAKHLFDVDVDKITPVVHRQSIIHSMVEFCDNSVIAQLGSADMRLPISYAINYPERSECISKPLDIFNMPDLTFAKPDYETFECLSLAIDAIKKGGLYPAVLNGANEAAVDLFLNDKIKFLDIAYLVKEALSSFKNNGEITEKSVLEADSFAREVVYEKGSKIKIC